MPILAKMSALTAPNLSQENAIEEISEDEKNTIYSYLRVLIDHLSCCGISTNTFLSDASAGKLTKLTVRHLMELASDMCDELDRRDIGSTSPLVNKPELTTKRNNARIRMAEFSSDKLNNLILEVVQEIDRRKVNFPSSKPVASNAEDASSNKKRLTLSDEAPQKHEVSSKKTKSSMSESKVQEKPSPVVKPVAKPNDNIFNPAGLCSGISIDSLDAMIEDLGSLINEDGNEEFSELKERYEAEIQNLKQMIEKYEKIIVVEKNSEISKLMTKIEETELNNTRIRKEFASLQEQLSIRDAMIEDQQVSYEILKESLDNIHKQISNRAIDALENSRNAARLELVSSNILSDLSTQNDHIIATLDGIDECASNFNQKTFLKLLRDIATSSKSFIILFDRILQVSHSFNINDISTEGENLKSEYISALSSLLVAGKDFSARPQYCSEFKSYVETFKIANETLIELKTRFEAVLQNN